MDPPSETAQVDVGSDSDSSDDDIIVFRRHDDKKKKKPLRWYRILKFMLPYALPQSLRLRFISVTVLTISLAMRVLRLVPAYALKLAVDSVAARNPKPPYFAILLYFGTQMVMSILGSGQSTIKEILDGEIQQKFAVGAYNQVTLLFSLSLL